MEIESKTKGKGYRGKKYETLEKNSGMGTFDSSSDVILSKKIT